jgi:lipoprotein-releasing system permease protein
MALPFPALLALRYLRSTRKDAFVTFLSAVAAGGVALGVAALILSLGALSGFQRALKAEILGRTPQVEIRLPSAADADAVQRAVAKVDGVQGAQLLLRGRGWLLSEGRAQAAEVVGYEKQLPAAFPATSAEAASPAGVWISEGMTHRWGLEPGMPVEVASARPTLTPLGPQPRVRALTVAGTFATGRSVDEERVALPLEVAVTLLPGADRRLEVRVASLSAALEVARELRPLLPPGSELLTWQDLNAPLFFALRLEKSVMFVAVFLIVIVASLALIADLALIIASKTPEIGMLGAMGASPATLRRIFLLLGAALSGLGALGGGALGVGAALILDRYRLLRLPERVYFLDYVPFVVLPWDLVAVVGLTVALALACSLYAAQRAAALDPVEALRR